MIYIYIHIKLYIIIITIIIIWYIYIYIIASLFQMGFLDSPHKAKILWSFWLGIFQWFLKQIPKNTGYIWIKMIITLWLSCIFWEVHWEIQDTIYIYIYDHHMISRCNIHTVTSSYQLLPPITQSTYVETGSVSRLLRIQLSNKVAQKRFTLVGLDGHI